MKKMPPPNSSPAMYFPKSLPLRQYEIENSLLSPPGWHQSMAGLHIDKSAIGAHIHDLAASNGMNFNPAPVSQGVNWQQEFEQSQQRRAANDAILKVLDKELEVKIAKLKAETVVRKNVICAKIMEEDRARLKQLLARLEISSNPGVTNGPRSEEQNREKVETAQETPMISPHDDNKDDMTYERNACEMETRPSYPHYFHKESKESYHESDGLRRMRPETSWERHLEHQKTKYGGFNPKHKRPLGVTCRTDEDWFDLMRG